MLKRDMSQESGGMSKKLISHISYLMTRQPEVALYG